MLFSTPVTTRENVDAPVTVKGTRACPGILGGVQWDGSSYNAMTKMLYTPAVDWCGMFKVDDEIRHVPGKNYLGGDFAFDSPTSGSGWLTAVDAMTGGVKWKYYSSRPMVGDTGGPIGAGIATYSLGGTQYIAVASGSPSPYWTDQHPGAPTIFVFALKP